MRETFLLKSSVVKGISEEESVMFSELAFIGDAVDDQAGVQ